MHNLKRIIMKSNAELNHLLTKYAEVENIENRPVMAEPIKDAIAGGLGAVSGLPFLYPLDAKITRRQAGAPLTIKGQPFRNLLRAHYGGIGLKALKIAPAMAITFATVPLYKKFLNKRFKNK